VHILETEIEKAFSKYKGSSSHPRCARYFLYVLGVGEHNSFRFLEDSEPASYGRTVTLQPLKVFQNAKEIYGCPL
jgi:hypothetical protein